MHAPATDSVLRFRFRMIGLMLTVGCGALTATFGLSMAKSMLVSAILTAVLIGADLGNAYVWPYVLRKLNGRHYGEAIFAAAIGALSTVVCLGTAFGSVSHLFNENVASAKFQNTKLEDVGVIIAKEEDNERIYVNRIAELSKASGGWGTTTTADALRAKLPALNLAIEQEAARGGCKALCLQRTKERDEISEKIGTLEAIRKTERLLAATREALAKYRDKRGVTERGESVALDQMSQVASFVTASLEPTEYAKQWTGKGIAWMLTLFVVFGALGFNALGYASDEIEPKPEGAGWFKAKPAAPITPAAPVVVHKIEKDDAFEKYAASVRALINNSKAA